MAQQKGNGDGGMAQLRRWTVAVLLLLLSFVTVNEAFNPSFHANPALYTVVGGMVAGLFVAEGVAVFRRRKDE